jgi:hypothetical protein
MPVGPDFAKELEEKIIGINVDAVEYCLLPEGNR